MKQANVRFNYHDYLQLPEDKRYEILDGELCVVPAPSTRHQTIGLNLLVALAQYVKGSGSGRIFHAPCDVVLSQENVVQPDVIFVSTKRLQIVGEPNIAGSPDLLIEILSPGTRGRDLEIKRKLYARFGVQEYWIVDPEDRTIQILSWTDAGYRIEAVVPPTGTLNSPLFPSLNLNLADIF